MMKKKDVRVVNKHKQQPNNVATQVIKEVEQEEVLTAIIKVDANTINAHTLLGEWKPIVMASVYNESEFIVTNFLVTRKNLKRPLDVLVFRESTPYVGVCDAHICWL
jgi:Cu2+-containing amine oxidase